MTIGEAVSKVNQQLYDSGATAMFWPMLVEFASRYFEDCIDDFCLQNWSGADVVVFGGTNRLVWSIRHGFRPDRSYCTERFLAHADALGNT